MHCNRSYQSQPKCTYIPHKLVMNCYIYDYANEILLKTDIGFGQFQDDILTNTYEENIKEQTFLSCDTPLGDFWYFAWFSRG